MKVYLKSDSNQVGTVMDVYVTSSGQKRMNVRFLYSIIDADVSAFEVVQ